MIRGSIMNRLLIGCNAVLLSAVAHGVAQLPAACKPPASAFQAPPGTSRTQVYDAVGVWFAQKGDSNCAVEAFKEALRLEPHSAESHFDLGLVRQSQNQPAAAISEFRLALQYDPTLLQAYCAIGSSISSPVDAAAEFRKALTQNPQLVCALDGMAQALVKERRYDAALDLWRQAIRIQPDAPDMQLALATATYKAAQARKANGLPAVEGADVADAIRLLADLIKNHPDLTAAHFTLGNIYANERRDREAADEYYEVVRRDPGDTAALAAQVRALIDTSAYAEALSPARDYVRQKPGDASAHIMLGTVYQQLGDYAKAEPELEIGVARTPDDFEAQYQLGLVLARMSKPAKALAHLQKAVALKPGDRAARYQLVAVLRALGRTQESTQLVEQLRKEQDKESLNSQLAAEGTKANDLLQSGHASEAVQLYRHMLEEKPDSAWTAYNLALALEAMNDMRAAEDALHNAISLDPKQAKIQAELGRLELAKGDLQSAQKWLESALNLEPGLVEARGNLAMLNAKKGNLVSAEKLFRQALEDDPAFKEGHLNLGLVLAQQNRKPDAEKEFEKAIALAPNDPATLSTIGKAEMKMGKVSEGTAFLRQVVDLAPDSAAAHLDLALALSESYNFSAALEQTSDAIRLAPQSAFAHFYRGRVLYDLGRTKEAQPEFEAARRLNAQMAEPRYFLALIQKQAGNYDVAATLLQETVSLQPHNAMAWYMLGQCFEKLSDPAKTTAAWRKAIEADPKFTQALISLSRAVQTSDPTESEELRARYTEVQKERRVLDRADTLANNGIEAASAHDWLGAIQQLKEAIQACGDCAAKADLYRKLGIIECQAGDLTNGEKELKAAKALKPDDPVTEAALELIAQARIRNPGSAAATPSRRE